MSQRRGTATDQLSNVIQVIQLGRKTGFLTVERGEGPNTEEGELTFVQGQITNARGGYLTGQQAIQWLSNWGACRFIFVPSVPDKTTQPLNALPSPTPIQPSKDTGQLPQSLRQISESHHPVTPPYLIRGREERVTPAPLSYQPSSLGFSYPRRIRQDDESLRLLDQAGLSRLHRNLFMLIDGHRTTMELIRLIGRKPEEVQRLLYDLERIGIIQQ